jgi:hypothetical protein
MRKVTMVAALLVLSGCVVTTTEPGGGAAPAETPGAQAQAATGLLASLDRIVFDMQSTGTSLEVQPLLLLTDGAACDCLDLEIDVVTIDEVRATKPKRVGEWRQGSERIEVKWTSTWRKVAFSASAVPLGDDWRPDASYERVSSVGSVGSDYVGAASTLTFASDGTFRNGTAVVAPGHASSSKDGGTYAVSGWMLTLTYGDGTVRRTSAVGSTGEGSSVWLGRNGWSLRK